MATFLIVIGCIIAIIGYLQVGMFLGSFAVDDPATPYWVGYLVVFTWPFCIAGLLAWSLVSGLAEICYKFYLLFFRGIWIETDIYGKKVKRKIKKDKREDNNVPGL